MKRGASLVWPRTRAIFCQSVSWSLPLRSAWSLMPASAEMRRVVISVRLISREKMTVA